MGNIIAVLLTTAVVVLAWKMVLPAYFSHKNTLVAMESEISAIGAKIDSLKKTSNDLASIKSTTDQLLVAVPGDSDEPDLIAELEAIGIKNNVVIPAIDISASETLQNGSMPTASATASGNTSAASQGEEGTTTAATAAIPITVSFTVEGSFEDLNNLIVSLEKSIRYMNIKNLTYSADSESGELSLAIQLEAYSRDNSTSAGATGTP